MLQCAGSLDEVKDNVRQFGALDHCEFIPGFFFDTLATLKADELSFVFMDVDYISSARDCLCFLWPKLARGSRLYTHGEIIRTNLRHHRPFVVATFNQCRRYWSELIQPKLPQVRGRNPPRFMAAQFDSQFIISARKARRCSDTMLLNARGISTPRGGRWLCVFTTKCS
jgi:hypothetical protein